MKNAHEKKLVKIKRRRRSSKKYIRLKVKCFSRVNFYFQRRNRIIHLLLYRTYVIKLTSLMSIIEQITKITTGE